MSHFQNTYFLTKPRHVYKFPEDAIPLSGQEGLVITFEMAQSDAIKGKSVWSSANTVWWTTNPVDIKKGAVPMDAFGSPLFVTDKVIPWFTARKIMEHPSYGKPERRIRNFMLAHAKNIHLACDKMPSKSFDKVESFVDFCKFCDENDI